MIVGCGDLTILLLGLGFHCFLFRKRKTASQPWQAIAQRFCSIIISVSNPTEYIPFSEIENMFVCGYSSKGENRGIGLSRVKELANKYEANIKVSNFWYDEENWINFTVEIVK